MRFLKALFGCKSSQNKSSKASIQSSARVITGLKSFPLDVVGESHYQDALRQIAGGYRRDSQTLAVTAAIALDPDNQFDPHAVRVEIDGQTVGFIPAKQAHRVGGFMRDQGVDSAGVEAQVRGGWRTNQYDQGHFGVRLKMPQSGWIDFGVGAEKPKAKSRKAASERKPN